MAKWTFISPSILKESRMSRRMTYKEVLNINYLASNGDDYSVCQLFITMTIRGNNDCSCSPQDFFSPCFSVGAVLYRVASAQ